MTRRVALTITTILAIVASLTPLTLALEDAAAATLVAGGSVNQVYATGATPGATLELQRDGATVASGTADPAGTFVFGIQYGTTDDLPAGSGYTVREVGGATSGAVTVTDPDDVPDQAFYDGQDLPYGVDDGQTANWLYRTVVAEAHWA